MPLSTDPPGGPEDGVAELPESVHLPGEPAAARGRLPPGESAGGGVRGLGNATGRMRGGGQGASEKWQSRVL